MEDLFGETDGLNWSNSVLRFYHSFSKRDRRARLCAGHALCHAGLELASTSFRGSYDAWKGDDSFEHVPTGNRYGVGRESLRI
jgi:hypothetical protein